GIGQTAVATAYAAAATTPACRRFGRRSVTLARDEAQRCRRNRERCEDDEETSHFCAPDAGFSSIGPIPSAKRSSRYACSIESFADARVTSASKRFAVASVSSIARARPCL